MSKFRIAWITFAQGSGTSRRNARQSDPNILSLAYHSPLCWHSLPKHRFRAEMQWNLSFREMHRCHGRALHALKDINQCRRIPVLCGPGQHSQLFYKSNELKPSIPLKFVLPWSNCDMVFEGVKFSNSNHQEKSFWVSCATRPIHSVHGRLRHRQSWHVLKEFDNGSWWIPAGLLDAHVATWVNWANLLTWVLSCVVDFREYILLRNANVTKISNHSKMKKRLLSRYMITLDAAPGYAWQYLGNVGPAGLVNRTALGTGEIALCPGRMYWDPQTEKGQLRTQGSRFTWKEP